MYNRYIPQSDGSYCRKTIPDSCAQKKQSQSCAPAAPPPPPPPPREQRQSKPHPQHHPPQPSGIGSFLRRILPENFDTGDLMIVLLLLLMAGDCQEDQNWAILTLVLYLFL